MSFFKSMDISASGLTAQRVRMDLISQNLANTDTTRTEKGTPYRRKIAVFEAQDNGTLFSQYLSEESKAKYSNVGGNGGVRVTKIIEDQSAFRRTYNPSHPDADEDGYVLMPNIDVMTEMVNMISATRSYEANVTAMNSSKSMAMKALGIGK